MRRDHWLQLDDMLLAVARIKTYLDDMDYDAFRADTKTQDAVVRNS